MRETKNYLFRVLIIAMIISFAQSNKSISQVIDKDGNEYKTVIIGSQEWMSENLNAEHYRNGDIIPQVQDADEWIYLKSGAWCYLKNDSENGKIYGRLYNWYAVNDSRGLAPDGWHIPSYAEWKNLKVYLGGYLIAGGKLKATILWDSPNTGATNESGFTALPGGNRYGWTISPIGSACYFWSSSKYEYERGYAYFYYLGYNHSLFLDKVNGKHIGMSIRCMKD